MPKLQPDRSSGIADHGVVHTGMMVVFRGLLASAYMYAEKLSKTNYMYMYYNVPVLE